MHDMPHVLLVEDDEAHAELVSSAFDDQPDRFTLEHVETLAEARECLKGDLPDLAIVDLLLPDGRGTDIFADIPEKRINITCNDKRQNRMILFHLRFGGTTKT